MGIKPAPSGAGFFVVQPFDVSVKNYDYGK
jgi:hypothetical protein